MGPIGPAATAAAIVGLTGLLMTLASCLGYPRHGKMRGRSWTRVDMAITGLGMQLITALLVAYALIH
jgi:hypothetical protein